MGAELCATHQNSKPSAVDCVRAWDETYKGRVDLSKNVSIGEPVHKTGLHWSVPYDVKDEAGNKAATVWRDVIVEEVELDDLESRLRRQFEKEKEAAIQKALADNEKKARGNPRRQNQKCPECPKCDCSNTGGGLDEATCMAMCKEREGSCAVEGQGWVHRVMVWFENFPGALLVVSVLALLFGFKFLYASFFGEQKAYQPPYNSNPEHLQRHVTIYQQGSPSANGYNGSMNGGYGIGPSYDRNGHAGVNGGHVGTNNMTNGGGSSFLAPPRSSMSLGDRSRNEGMFSPPSGGVRSYASSAVGRPSPPMDIYEDSPLITPNKRGSGVRRRSPFSR